jgi:hypothetical protein
LIVATLILLMQACTQRTEPPPTNRDGIAGGSDTPKQQQLPPATGEQEPVTLPGKDVEYKYILGPDEFTVLMGRYATREEAEERSFALRMKRISNFVEQVGGEWLLCVGRYYSEAGARRTLRSMQRMGFEGAETYGPGHPF